MAISDTHPEMVKLHNLLLRQASPAEKLEMLANLNAAARLLAIAGLHQRYPQQGEAELERMLAELLLGEELAKKVYGEM
jgi:hypothetical protein